MYKRPAGSVGWTKLNPGGSLKHNLFNTGVTGSPQVRKGGLLMMITSISYLIIQASSGRRLLHCVAVDISFSLLVHTPVLSTGCGRETFALGNNAHCLYCCMKPWGQNDQPGCLVGAYVPCFQRQVLVRDVALDMKPPFST